MVNLTLGLPYGAVTETIPAGTPLGSEMVQKVALTQNQSAG